MLGFDPELNENPCTDPKDVEDRNGYWTEYFKTTISKRGDDDICRGW